MSDYEYLSARAPDYRPSAEVAGHLSGITLIPLIGPMAVGKSSCMDRVAETDGSFGRVQSFTTRPRRSDEAEDEYRFLDHDDGSLGRISCDVRSGALVQYAVHPTTGYVYGSDQGDYAKPYMMLDALAGSVPAIRRLPFGGIVEISVVAEPGQWIERFKRRKAEPMEAAKRLREGAASLRWSLDQGEPMIWLCNAAGRLSEAALEIRDVSIGRREPDRRNRAVGERLLRALQDLA